MNNIFNFIGMFGNHSKKCGKDTPTSKVGEELPLGFSQLSSLLLFYFFTTVDFTKIIC